MCGITGIIHYRSKDNHQQALQQSTDAMQYRGPDYTDHYYEGPASLGHLRLSIVDLNPRSHQPFHSKCGRYVIVYNGEIYGFQDFRNQMIKNGFEFRSQSDTEVLLEGFIQFGPAILQKLRGMWAFAIWDKQQEKLFVARDRFGEKPFYYHWNADNQKFSFSSNLAGLLPLLGNSLEIDIDAVRQLLNYQYILHDTCIYKGIKKLPAAHYGWVSKSGFVMVPYWQLDYREKHGKSYMEMKKETTDLLVDSIQGQLMADVPVGLFLSGGVDSGLITGIAATLKKDLMAVTMTVPGNEQYNEEDNAGKVAKHCGLQHHKVPLDESCIGLLPHVLATMEPLADNSLIPSLFVAKYAGQHLRVMLSGDGGDEFFGGYGLPLRYHQSIHKPNTFTDSVVRQSLRNAYSPVFSTVSNRLDAAKIIRFAKPETFFLNNILPYDLQKKLFKKSASSNNESLVDFYQQSKNFTDNPADAMMWMGVHTKMTDDFLFKMDSANMLFSVENRSPFLDHRLAELTAGARIQDLMPTGIDKQMLKQIGEDFIPKEVLYEKKKGFAIPIRDFLDKKWLGSLLQMADEGLSMQAGIFEPDGIKQVVAMYRKSKSHKLAKVLYSVLIFEIWLRVFHLEMNADEVAAKYL